MRAAGLKHLHLGDGTWTIDHGGLDDDSALITVNDGETITGNGPNRTIIQCTNETSGSDTGVALFRGAVDACNVRFAGLDFRGSNSPYVSATFNENECIAPHYLGTSTDWLIEDCFFRNLEGFAVHDRQGVTNARIHVRNCTGIEIGNSLANVNSDYTHIDGCTVVSGEFAECSGKGVVIVNNIIKNATGVGITIGGNQTLGLLYPGNVIANNTIDGGTGVGITVTDGASSTVVANNVVRKCEDGGLLISHSINPVEGCIIIGNVFESNCADPGANLSGMDIRSGGRHLIYGNVSIDLAESGFNQLYGLTITDSVDNVVDGNYFSCTSHDASFSNGATGTRLGQNVYANNTMEVIGTATLVAQSITGKAATDLVWTTRYNSGSSLTERAYFGLYADGKLTWGNNLDLLSAQLSNLYRSAADTLKTDGAFIAAGAITGSNLSGTNSGNVTLTAVGASPNANGASLSTQALTLQPANGTHPGLLAAADFTKLAAQSGTNTGDVTIGTANGLSLVGQALSMAAAGAAATGTVTTGAQTIAGNKSFSGSTGVGHTATPQYDLDGGTALANTKWAIYNNVPSAGSSIVGFGVQSGKLIYHTDVVGSAHEWRAIPAGGATMTLTGAGALNTAGAITMNSVAVLSQTNTVSGITNKTFTSPTINAATISGTIGGNATLSGNLALTGTCTFSLKQVHLVQNTITAFATGGQASATALTGEHCYVTTCATAGDSVKLPVAVAGYEVWVFNAGAASCNVFPQSGSDAGAGTNTAVAVAAGTGKTFYAQTTTQWRST
jgi:hypothetical protein